MMVKLTPSTGISAEAEDGTHGLGVVEGATVVVTSDSQLRPTQYAEAAWATTTTQMIPQQQRRTFCVTVAALLHMLWKIAIIPRWRQITQNISLEGGEDDLEHFKEEKSSIH